MAPRYASLESKTMFDCSCHHVTMSATPTDQCLGATRSCFEILDGRLHGEGALICQDLVGHDDEVRDDNVHIGVKFRSTLERR